MLYAVSYAIRGMQIKFAYGALHYPSFGILSAI